MKLEQRPLIYGFLQAVGVIVYVALIAFFLQAVEAGFAGNGPVSIMLMLALLVFSAAVTGSLVFGCPSYLVLKGKFKQAVTVLAWTVTFLLIFLLTGFIFIF